jgi:transglutaminase-like putative cysteine protease/uncharacterized membrane protein
MISNRIKKKQKGNSCLGCLVKLFIGVVVLIVGFFAICVVISIVVGIYDGITGKDTTSKTVVSTKSSNSTTKNNNEQKSRQIITNIANIKNESMTLLIGSPYTLPNSLGVLLKSGNTGSKQIQWDKQINTKAIGTTTYTGTVKDYNKPVIYTITVLPIPSLLYFHNIETNSSSINVMAGISNDVDNRNITWVLITLTKDGSQMKYFVKSDNGVLDPYILYLPFGSGTYITDISYSMDLSEDGYNIDYYDEGKFTITNNDTRDMSYLLPSRYVESDSSEIIQLAQQITENCYSDMDKTKAIHDWVAKNISYDSDAFLSNKNKEYSALDTLHNKKALCNGYANLTAALNRAIGIKAKVCSGTANSGDGTSNGHAWNETFVDNKWIIQDTTWDAGSIDSATGEFSSDFSEKYFNPTASDFAKDHNLTSEADTQ